jgi:hypothetical protein
VLDLVLLFAALLPQTIGPYIAIVLCGFAIGILGHLSSSRALVAAGVILIALGALLLPLALDLSTDKDPPAVESSE